MSKILTIAIILFFTACSKQNNNCFTIKFIEGICGENVYQITDNNYTHLGQNNWRTSNGSTYDHVFLMENPCRTIQLDANKNATVYINNSNSDGCITCQATLGVPLPTKRLNVKPCQ
jgi:hypothetical protein